VLKEPMNCWMIGPPLKPQDVYDSWKTRHSNNWKQNQNTILCSNV
jgi:hypothetical protein